MFSLVSDEDTTTMHTIALCRRHSDFDFSPTLFFIKIQSLAFRVRWLRWIHRDLNIMVLESGPSLDNHIDSLEGRLLVSFWLSCSVMDNTFFFSSTPFDFDGIQGSFGSLEGFEKAKQDHVFNFESGEGSPISPRYGFHDGDRGNRGTHFLKDQLQHQQPKSRYQTFDEFNSTLFSQQQKQSEKRRKYRACTSPHQSFRNS
ncbi:uncharacterized protein LOC122315309 isoform X2 [Carya illinoinensis]|uniref:uncharacterized protein LOC122315309 isoform X2 n=1 Tax=Carya illinoinensis TaxID=32201 RepID=UPI001C7226E1|nr:uncharacterized protein LOC122315309 isoform X2 [Carya illinoinensis]